MFAPHHVAGVSTPRPTRARAAVLCLTLLAACGENTPTDPPPTSGATLFAGSVAAGLTQNPTAPAVALATDGSRLVLHASGDGGQLIAGTLHTSAGGDLVVYPGEDGLPARVIAGSQAILFQNWRADKVDVAFVDSDGQVEVRRDVVIPDAARRYRQAMAGVGAAGLRATRTSASARSPQIATAPDPATAAAYMRLVATSGGLATCMGTALGWVPTPASPALLALFSAGCVANVVDAVSQLRGEQVDPFFQSIQAVNLLAGSHGCIANAEQCAQTAADAAAVVLARVDEWVQAREAELALADGALRQGGGDVQITLAWTSTADVDLWVVDPAGHEIGWSSPSSPTGAELDRDDTDGFGPENVFWARGGAPSGQYRVRVQLYSGAAPTSFTVLVSAGGFTRQYQGTLTSVGQDVGVVTFTLGQPLPNAVTMAANRMGQRSAHVSLGSAGRCGGAQKVALLPSCR